MPKRSNEFQAIMHAVRLETATDNVTVTESKMLPSSEGGEREVDIVIEGEFDGEPIVTSIEVIDRKRKADVTWVEQMIAKHHKLPTNRLVLISSSGFYRTALVAVAAQNGTVEALTPEVVTQDGQPVVERFEYSQVSMRPTLWEVVVQDPGPRGGVGVVNLTKLPNTSVRDRDDVEVGTLFELVLDAMRLPFIGKRFWEQAVADPVLAAKDAFTVVFSLAGCGYFLPFQEEGVEESERQPILALRVTGKFKFTHEVLEAGVARIGDRVFGSSLIEPGVRALWIQRPNGEFGIRRLERGEPLPEPKFKALLDIKPPAEWDETDEGRAAVEQAKRRFHAGGGKLTHLA